MGEQSKIEWTDHTFNPWLGCEKVSPGCDHCYAEVGARRLGAQHGLKLWGGDRYRTGEAYWKQPLKWNRDAAGTGRRAKVFCASFADVFEDREDHRPTRARLADLVRETPSLDWLFVTKRPQNADRLWTDAWIDSWNGGDSFGVPWGPNVWLGATVEDQARAEERIPALFKVPAHLRFLSCEPLLEKVDLAPYLVDDLHRIGRAPRIELDWVIVGGESGLGARYFDLGWARSIREQCRAAGVACFIKQLGADPIDGLAGCSVIFRDRKGGDWSEWPEELRVREVPDGR